jgi:hypothetical protein
MRFLYQPFGVLGSAFGVIQLLSYIAEDIVLFLFQHISAI